MVSGPGAGTGRGGSGLTKAAVRKDHLSRSEIRKDAVQGTVEAAATAVGQVTSIVTTAVRDVARAVGGFATEVFEIRDSARRASADQAGEGRPRP
jgi:hypothetical protein